MTITKEITKNEFNIIRKYILKTIEENRHTYKETACLQIYNEIKGKKNSHELSKTHHCIWYFERTKIRILKEIEELLEKTEEKENQDD